MSKRVRATGIRVRLGGVELNVAELGLLSAEISLSRREVGSFSLLFARGHNQNSNLDGLALEKELELWPQPDSVQPLFKGQVWEWMQELDSQGGGAIALRGFDKGGSLLKTRKTRSWTNFNLTQIAHVLATEHQLNFSRGGSSSFSRAGSQSSSSNQVRAGFQTAKGHQGGFEAPSDVSAQPAFRTRSLARGFEKAGGPRSVDASRSTNVSRRASDSRWSSASSWFRHSRWSSDSRWPIDSRTPIGSQGAHGSTRAAVPKNARASKDARDLRGGRDSKDGRDSNRAQESKKAGDWERAADSYRKEAVMAADSVQHRFLNTDAGSGAGVPLSRWFLQSQESDWAFLRRLAVQARLELQIQDESLTLEQMPKTIVGSVGPRDSAAASPVAVEIDDHFANLVFDEALELSPSQLLSLQGFGQQVDGVFCVQEHRLIYDGSGWKSFLTMLRERRAWFSGC